MPTSQPLGHLHEAELLDLITRYYSGERVATLLQDFNIQCSTSLLCTYFPPEPTDQLCRHCGSPMIKPRRSRTWKYVVEPHCTKCRHSETASCSCAGCEGARRRERNSQLEQQKRAVELFCLDRWSYAENSISPHQLSAYEAVGLISLVRCGGWLDESRVGPMQSSSIHFAPEWSDLPAYLLGRLNDAGLVSPDTGSSQQAFHWQQGIVVSWAPEKVQWALRMPGAIDFIHALEELAASPEWPAGWVDQCRELWHTLAIAECMEFCAYSVTQRDLPMPGATALAALFENLLRDLSVSQCYQLIWASAADATDYRARKHITAHHAANYMIGACQRRADRSRAEGWPIKGFHRNFELGRSLLSHVLHDVFFRHGEVGFFTCPNTHSNTPSTTLTPQSE